uniref:UDP-glucose glucosyltransferase n=1 Tax=Fragaria ananassa TaxID=3747 RepID=A0A387J066_FRAAN|nr:UDP-glucose glucosyltransferase [Fragaria x ananassa]
MSNSHAQPLLPHIALFPCAGMGHLTPFLRLASMLSSSQNCLLTLITASPAVSAAESTHISLFLSQHPKVNHLEFHLIPSDPTTITIPDPFFLQWQSTNHSLHLLYPSLASASPPLSAIFSDFVVAPSMGTMAAQLNIPNYIFSPTSCKFFCLMAYLPNLLSNTSDICTLTQVEIPGLAPLPMTSILPPFRNPNHIFTSLILQSSRALSTAKAILMNTFHEFESDTLASINDGTALHNINLPPILPIGPLKDLDIKNDHQDKYYLSWLDNQPKESVVYVSFGSRTAMSDSQIRELSKGLETSGYRFLWVLKTSKVDKDDIQEVSDMVGESFMERTKNKGIVLKAWVSQQDILEHPAIGGFVNHCGWNSVMEAAREGIPVLAWPQHGDQSVNAEIVEKAGLGIWERKWGWGLEGLVSAEEIRNKIVELMEHEKVRSCSKKVGEEARKASGIDGRSEKVVKEIMQSLMQKRN